VSEDNTGGAGEGMVVATWADELVKQGRDDEDSRWD